MAQNNVTNSAYNAQPKAKRLLLANLFTDAPIRKEPEEPKKVITAGLVEATPAKEYPDTFFGRAYKVFTGEFQTLFKSALFFVLFTVPFILVLAWLSGLFEQSVIGTYHNFMGNVGVGFPGGGDSITLSRAKLLWEVKVPVVGMLAGCLLFGSLGLSGLFYCAKRSYFQHVYKRSARTYWMGFAKYWWKFFVSTLALVSIGYAMIVALIYLLQQQTLGTADAGAYCAVVFSWVFGAPMLLVPMVMMSLFTSYELTFVQCFKNALVIIANSPVVVVLTAIISVAPLALCALNGFFPIIICVIMAFAGCTFMSLAWIAMGDRGMVKCHNRKVETDKMNMQAMRKQAKLERKQKSAYNPAPSKSDKNKANGAQKNAQNGAQKAVQNSNQQQGTNNKPKKKQPTPYQNPKKKKKK